ncbi:MAG TPA: hypothetical protein VFE16_04400 [Candidatus Cybelea sp.]|jgi:hypothetical protein|nr:hypothetical protein [Candidatus Cybelea sp.]
MRRLLLAISLVAATPVFGGCGSGIQTPSAGAAATLPSLASLRAGHAPPVPPRMRHRITAAEVSRSRAAGWQRVLAPVSWSSGPGTELLMTDGTVMVQDTCTRKWQRLTPNRNGSYLSGRWSRAALMPRGYAPEYFASAVLANGNLIVNGGEYNGPGCTAAQTTLGAMYDPFNDTWTTVAPPTGWPRIGDGSSVVLADGTYMLGNCCFDYQALFDLDSSEWTQTGPGNGKDDVNSEEGWTLLPNGTVLVVNVRDTPYAQVYNPSANTWTPAGALPVNIVRGSEIGPQMLRPNGTVFVAGANGLNVVYNAKNGKWTQTQSFPVVNGSQLDVADGPAALLTDGNVMIPASPGLYNAPAYYYLFDGSHLTGIAGPPNAPNDSTFNTRLLVLPTGQIMETDGSHDIEIYTSRRSGARFAPAITSVPSTLSAGGTFTVSGTGFNGISQANAYGDDDQQATNYPLVRIVATASGRVTYCRTHGTSFMGVASGQSVSTSFDVPPDIESGAGTLVVVANGIPSAPVAVTVESSKRPLRERNDR